MRGIHRFSRAARPSALALSVTLCWWSGVEGAGECWDGLDDLMLRSLRLFTNAGNVTAGDTVTFRVGITTDGGSGYYYIPACVEWSVSPPGLAAIVQFPEYPEKGWPSGSANGEGVLVIDPAAPPRTVVTLAGSVQGGLRVLEARYHVYEPDLGPLVGIWSEFARLKCPYFMNGDVDQGGGLEVTDAIRVFSYLFLGGEEPRCLDSADSNRDSRIDISDGLFILRYLFAGEYVNGAFPECRPHGLGSRLSCDHAEGCSSDGEELPSPVEIPIRELVIRADRTFSVRWEDGSHYAGTYRYDRAGAVSFEIQGGNHGPGDEHLANGAFTIQGDPLRDQLLLERIWFGSPEEDEVEIACGHLFERWK